MKPGVLFLISALCIGVTGQMAPAFAEDRDAQSCERRDVHSERVARDGLRDHAPTWAIQSFRL
mgnify:CR=1 FL=1